jgi:hypothetical protein
LVVVEPPARRALEEEELCAGAWALAGGACETDGGCEGAETEGVW